MAAAVCSAMLVGLATTLAAAPARAADAGPDLCVPLGATAPVWGVFQSGTTAPIIQWDATTRARIPSPIPPPPASVLVSGQSINALMIDPVHSRMVAQVTGSPVTTGSYLIAYDVRQGGWYVASDRIWYESTTGPALLPGNLPRGGFSPSGIGYMVFALTGGGVVWKVTPTDEFMYDVTEINRLDDPGTSGSTSGDLAFDASGRGWILAGSAAGVPAGQTMQLSTFVPSETPGELSANEPYLRLTLNGGDIPASWLLTGFAFGGDGHGYITINTGGVRGLYRFSLSDGALVRLNPADSTYAGWTHYDAASCTFPAISATTAVEKTISDESGLLDGVAEPGETITYRIRVTNTGTIGRTVAGASIRETIPAHTTAAAGDDFTFVAGAPAGSVATASTQITLAPGAHADYVLRVNVDASLPLGPLQILNTVSVDGADCAASDCAEPLPAGGTLSGAVSLDGSLAPIAGVTVELLDGSGEVVATTTTAADGTYSFTTLTAGTYTIREVQPAGYGQGSVVPIDRISVVVALGATVTGNDFSEKLASLSGRVIDIAAGAALPGVTLTLSGIDDLLAPFSRTAVTGTDGRYAFLDLRPGTYAVTETQPLGYIDPASAAVVPGSTGGTAGTNTITGITLGAGIASTGNDFNETRPPVTTTTLASTSTSTTTTTTTTSTTTTVAPPSTTTTTTTPRARTTTPPTAPIIVVPTPVVPGDPDQTPGDGSPPNVVERAAPTTPTTPTTATPTDPVPAPDAATSEPSPDPTPGPERVTPPADQAGARFAPTAVVASAGASNDVTGVGRVGPMPSDALAFTGRPTDRVAFPALLLIGFGLLLRRTAPRVTKEQDREAGRRTRPTRHTP